MAQSPKRDILYTAGHLLMGMTNRSQNEFAEESITGVMLLSKQMRIAYNYKLCYGCLVLYSEKEERKREHKYKDELHPWIRQNSRELLIFIF